jgi:hypothetical protein
LKYVYKILFPLIKTSAPSKNAKLKDCILHVNAIVYGNFTSFKYAKGDPSEKTVIFA